MPAPPTQRGLDQKKRINELKDLSDRSQESRGVSVPKEITIRSTWSNFNA